MVRRRSNRLKTWRRSHVNRLQIGRQRRVGVQGGWNTAAPTAPLFVLAAPFGLAYN